MSNRFPMVYRHAIATGPRPGVRARDDAGGAEDARPTT